MLTLSGETWISIIRYRISLLKRTLDLCNTTPYSIISQINVIQTCLKTCNDRHKVTHHALDTQHRQWPSEGVTCRTRMQETWYQESKSAKWEIWKFSNLEKRFFLLCSEGEENEGEENRRYTEWEQFSSSVYILFVNLKINCGYERIRPGKWRI